MKTVLSLLSVATVLTTGCTTYPKNYTYSPTVTISGENVTSTPLILPNPFAKTPRSKTDYNVNYSSTETQGYYPTYDSQQTYVFVGPDYLQPQ